MSLKWNTLAAKAASAFPFVKTSTKCSIVPAPPEAMIGIFTVSDNGIGVSEENIPKVFEPKFTTKTSGMGLGLPMIKNIVETYNGSITFVSKENEGTTFRVTFPKE